MSTYFTLHSRPVAVEYSMFYEKMEGKPSVYYKLYVLEHAALTYVSTFLWSVVVCCSVLSLILNYPPPLPPPFL
jgi:hypothetical protein